MLVLTLLSHGCPTQAIVAAFGLDERTVARWLAGAGQHCQRVHEHLVEQGQRDLQHVQADELWVKQVGAKVADSAHQQSACAATLNDKPIV